VSLGFSTIPTDMKTRPPCMHEPSSRPPDVNHHQLNCFQIHRTTSDKSFFLSKAFNWSCVELINLVADFHDSAKSALIAN
jgi:hypothetical protein